MDIFELCLRIYLIYKSTTYFLHMYCGYTSKFVCNFVSFLQIFGSAGLIILCIVECKNGSDSTFLSFAGLFARMLIGSALEGGFTGMCLEACVCAYTECCNDKWIRPNISELELKLNQNLYGQHLVTGPLIKHLGEHFEGQPNNALVLSLHGTTGTGKTFVSKFVAEAVYREGMKSRYVHFLSATNDFPQRSKIDIYKKSLQQTIENAIHECPKSLFIIDEMDKMPPQLIQIINRYLYHNSYTKEMDMSQAIFIFLSNARGTNIRHAVIKQNEEGLEREKITFQDIENIIHPSENMQPWNGFLLPDGLITAFIPFLPLERKHVKQCIITGLFRKGYYEYEYQINHEKVDEIANELMYFTSGALVLSTSGCKRVLEKIDLVMH